MYIILALLGFLSASVYFSIKGINADRTLPIMILGSALVTYLAGFFAGIKVGFYLVVIIAITFWILTIGSVYKDIRGRNIEQKRIHRSAFVEHFFTPGILFFLTFLCLSIWITYGMLAHNGDELSHWITIVKAMSLNDSFGTNLEVKGVYFRTYLPGIALIQYLMEKVYQIFYPEGFCEWICFFGCHMLCATFMLPLFSNIRNASKQDYVLISVCLFLIPLIFYENYYSYGCSDHVLGMAIAGTFSLIFNSRLYNDFSWSRSINIYLLIAFMVLIKDTGMLFSIFAGILYLVEYVGQIKQNGSKPRLLIIGMIIGLVLSIFLPKSFWTILLKRNGLYEGSNYGRINFNTKGFRSLLESILSKSQIIRNYFDALNGDFIDGFGDDYLKIGNTSVYIPVMTLLILLCSVLIIVMLKFARKEMVTYVDVVTVVGSIVVMSIFFIVGLCLAYMYNFSEYEGVNLASFRRYQSILFLGLTLFTLYVVWNYSLFTDNKTRSKFIVVIVLLLAISVPPKPIVYELARTRTMSSQSRRAPYKNLAELIRRNTQKDDNVWVISTGDKGLDGLTMSFELMPRTINRELKDSTNIGTNKAVDDMYMVNMDPETLENKLKQEYDYVALFKIDEDFVEEYGVVFEDENDIQEGHLYKVDNDTGLLSYVECHEN